MTSDLLRQRRNLILISVLLLAFVFLKIKVDKLSILGSEITVENPQGILVFVWIIWAYFLVRYYQFLREKSDLELISNINGRFSSKANSHVFKKLNKQFIQGSIEFSRAGIFWNYRVMEYDPSISSVQETSSGQLPGTSALFWFLGSSAHVFINTTKFTDYVLPLLVALSVPIVYLVKYFLIH